MEQTGCSGSDRSVRGWMRMASIPTWKGVLFEDQTGTCHCLTKGIQGRLNNDIVFLSLSVRGGRERGRGGGGDKPEFSTAEH